MRKGLARLLRWMGGGLLLVLVWLGYQLNQFLTQPIALQPQVQVVDIPSGASATRVATRLHQAGLLDSPKAFVWYLRYHNQHTALKAGEMRIESQWTVSQLAEALIRGETVKYPATLIAGHTFAMSLAQLQALPKLQRTLDLEDTRALHSALNLPVHEDSAYPFAGLEGQFLPETYLYEAGDSELSVLLRARRAMDDVLQAAWRARDPHLPLQNPRQMLILASLVEKETGVAEERPLIAGVFYNRLKKGMRLQTDPTIIYGMGERFDGNIRKQDLWRTTPYNTYRINGLPPTPIALPSRGALWAVAKPASTTALYFVSKGNGEHVFSDTLIEHNRAVQKYQINPK
jgi:UPF0755 protein